MFGDVENRSYREDGRRRSFTDAVFGKRKSSSVESEYILRALKNSSNRYMSRGMQLWRKARVVKTIAIVARPDTKPKFKSQKERRESMVQMAMSEPKK
eukprot:CAMPEP_0197320390 /NCGR_PEP_ID=MMETSP0891-20130614/59571_1 /TAXON_ID=44058 ORGANISM="Aureoumbra lagunensis, Strain CCMP1510" /NCGR_SAMPLE_ID=MMETSP0891 /ASSEMBLY_ACC=CAM_ASM_000534 /LENGTH=97 /DNA_ID=CAMNT_0042811757 /DNA_START=238 /DNA_END=528 /DNA_ORIENTATION=+